GDDEPPGPDARLPAVDRRRPARRRPRGALRRRHRGLDRPARARHHPALAGVRAAGLPALRPAPARAARGAADHRGLRPAAGDARPAAPGPRGDGAMNLLAVGCNYQRTAVGLRERLAFDGDKLPRGLDALCSRHDCEAVILSTCNRVELYLASDAAELGPDDVVRFVADFHGVPAGEVAPHLYAHGQGEAVRH